MKEDNKKSKLHEQVLKKIKDDNIRMRPKIDFVLRSILFAGGIILTLGLTLYLASFIIFVLRINGILALPGFGFRGYGALLLSLPWLLILLTAILVIVLELLGRHFSFVYRRPLLYSVFGIILFVIVSSVAVAGTSVHHKVWEFTAEYRVPFGPAFYERYGGGERPFRSGTIGTIVEIKDSELVIENTAGELFLVSTSTKTRFPREEILVVGDKIIILGKREGSAVEALGIRKINSLQDGIHPFNFHKTKGSIRSLHPF